jgi:hypothetical protein
MMNEQDVRKAREEMIGYIQQDVAGGFRSEGEICANVVDLLSDEYDVNELRRLAESLTREALATHLREQERWPERTDCDRLDAAFAELEGGGVMARQNYSCCGNCGAGEIWEEMVGAAERGMAVRGYTFYHEQDTEGAVEEGGVYLSYGAMEGNEEAIRAIAGEIVATVRRHGLPVEWDGTLARRIHVTMDWKRRRLL